MIAHIKITVCISQIMGGKRPRKCRNDRKRLQQHDDVFGSVFIWGYLLWQEGFNNRDMAFSYYLVFLVTAVRCL